MRIVAKTEWERIEHGPIPQHIGFIMDGNGRWAAGRGCARVAGHRSAWGATRQALDACARLRIGWVTFFAFSSENWKRPDDELAVLLRFSEWLWPAPVIEVLRATSARVHLVGIVDDPRMDPNQLSPVLSMRDLPSSAVDRGSSFDVVFAVNYGGRAELVRAIQTLRSLSGSPDITESTFRKALHCPDAPDLDLIIRTGGDQRLSNFMLWQAAYAELLFIDTLWPDLTLAQVYSAVSEYQSRQRRFGAI